jgi:hypothetical protein
MGAVYTLRCLDDKVDCEGIEFSVVGYTSIKHPDEAEQDLERWSEFIGQHNGHRLSLIDHHGNPGQPREMDGRYFFSGQRKVE